MGEFGRYRFTKSRRLRFFEHHATMIDYLHDGAILLLRPKSFSFFLLNLNLEIRSQRGFDNKRPNLHKKAKPEEFWS